MNEFSNRLGAIAQGVSREFEATATDDSAAMIRRAKRGRVVWTGAVGTATLATAAAVAVGGSAAANSVFDSADLEPAKPSQPAIEEVKAIPVPAAHWSKVDKLSADALEVKLAFEKAQKEKEKAEKLAAKKAAAKAKAAKEKAAKEKAAQEKKSWKHKHGQKWSDDKDCEDHKYDGGGSWKDKWKDKDSGGEEGGEGDGSSTEPKPESTEG